jgi:hypothetical protein
MLLSKILFEPVVICPEWNILSRDQSINTGFSSYKSYILNPRIKSRLKRDLNDCTWSGSRKKILEQN